MPSMLKKPHRKLRSQKGKSMNASRGGHKYYHPPAKQGSRKRIRHGSR